MKMLMYFSLLFVLTFSEAVFVQTSLTNTQWDLHNPEGRPSSVFRDLIQDRLDAINRTIAGLFEIDPKDAATKELYDHLKQMEGFKLVGYIPTAGSGVTVATGVDLGQWTAKQLTSMGVPEALVDKLSDYLGKKTRAEVKAANLKPSNLKISAGEAWALDKVFLAKNEKSLQPYYGQLSTKGQAVLNSLRHWNGSLKNTKGDGKLTRKIEGQLVSPVWEAVKSNSGTDASLLAALKATRNTFKKNTVGYNRLGKEIAYLNKK